MGTANRNWPWVARGRRRKDAVYFRCGRCDALLATSLDRAHSRAPVMINNLYRRTECDCHRILARTFRTPAGYLVRQYWARRRTS